MHVCIYSFIQKYIYIFFISVRVFTHTHPQHPQTPSGKAPKAPALPTNPSTTTTSTTITSSTSSSPSLSLTGLTFASEFAPLVKALEARLKKKRGRSMMRVCMDGRMHEGL